MGHVHSDNTSNKYCSSVIPVVSSPKKLVTSICIYSLRSSTDRLSCACVCRDGGLWTRSARWGRVAVRFVAAGEGGRDGTHVHNDNNTSK